MFFLEAILIVWSFVGLFLSILIAEKWPGSIEYAWTVRCLTWLALGLFWGIQIGEWVR